ncbi:PolC-type DNA polymerase III N-terminal domain-containing protein [Anaerostipes butyraticus]|uniref:PolC-type DNA polymerase III N-terminal domain-containing protein n=1 Tax=Anaerostipes butyraticus TaxID=645466 RepID=UPI00320A9EB0
MSGAAKPFFTVFPDLKVSDAFHSMFESVDIQDITLKKRDNMLRISFCCDHLISRVDTWRMEQQIREQLFSKRYIKIRFHETYHLSDQYNLKYLMEHYMKSFLFFRRPEESFVCLKNKKLIAMPSPN